MRNVLTAALIAAALIAAAGMAYAAAGTGGTDYVEYRYDVEPGDTVWDVAAKIALPEDDVRDVVRLIKKQNGITDAAALQPGQTLRVTVERAR